ncbi:MAG: peptide-methionine (R)-S-oxide reductase MsrB [Methanomicrobiales archaeon]|nr:peptide-methionine (R)-S-oxide reductase MsrB [Methanomicrobiales archaeon]
MEQAEPHVIREDIERWCGGNLIREPPFNQEFEGGDESQVQGSARVKKSESEWQNILPQDLFHVAREGGTEEPWTGCYVHCHENGRYHCVCCGADLFSSGEKFDSGTGWPSFSAPVVEENITTRPDTSQGAIRTELRCARCDAHLGHLFLDGPPPGRLRYCINSVCITLVPGSR